MSVERVSVFVDGSNFYKSCHHEFGKSGIDYAKFGPMLVGERKLVRTYFYTAVVQQETDSDKYAAQQRFLEKLRHLPCVAVRLGRLEKRGSTFVEKGVDINIAVDMLRHAYHNAYDTAILVSGDGDFATVVEAVKDLGKHVEVACLLSGQSYHLKAACDRYTVITKEMLDVCWLR